MPADFSEVTAEVTALETVVDSAVALINGIAARIDEAVAADNVVDASNLSALSASLRAQSTELGDAVAANTAKE